EFQIADDLSLSPAQCFDEMPIEKKAEEILIKQAGYPCAQASENGQIDQAGDFAILALPREEQDGLDFSDLLLSSAQMISNRQYDQAARLAIQCAKRSSQVGNPKERLAYYFSQALNDRIQREILGNLENTSARVPNFAFNIDSEVYNDEFFSLVAFYNQFLPFLKVKQFTSTQAIIDAVGNAKTIHVIDLGMRTGSQWTVLIQFLADRAASSSSSHSSSLELLTITAVGMNGEQLKKCGRRLQEFAKSFAVPFAYKMVEISNLEEIHEDLFEIKSCEEVAVNASIVLRSLLYDPILLDNLVSVLKKLSPSIMVIGEIEAQHNSTCFADRFVEVLSYQSMYFDMLDATFPDRNDIKRVKHEEVFVGNQIRNMIVCEGKDRRVRHVTTDVWRCFFRRAGFKEKSFSFKAKYQAGLMLNQFPNGDCYTLVDNGFAIIVGWKGYPLCAISAWT
ncbi:hypothetical protein KI387_042375, partial [Taxus chinensis]